MCARRVLLVGRAGRDVRPQDHHARPRVGVALADGGPQVVERPRVVEAQHVPAVAAVALRRRPRRRRARCRPRSRCGCRRRSRSGDRAAGGRRSTTPRRRRPPGGRRRSRCSTSSGRRSRGRAGCSAPPASAPRAPSRSRCRHPARVGRWWSRCPACRAAPGGRAWPSPTAGSAAGRRATPRSPRGAAPSTGGCRRGRHDSTNRSRSGQCGSPGSCSHHLLVEEVGDRRECHRRPGMARVRLLDRVHGERADGRDRPLFDGGHEVGSPVRLVVVLVERRCAGPWLGSLGAPHPVNGQWRSVVAVDLDRRVGDAELRLQHLLEPVQQGVLVDARGPRSRAPRRRRSRS